MTKPKSNPGKDNKPVQPQADVKKVEELLRQLPPEQSQLILAQYKVQLTRSGPLPDPEAFERYASLIPDGADRIMTMAEKSQQHMIDNANGYRRLATTGQWISAFLVLLFIIAGVYSVYMGAETAASICFGFGVVSVVSVFITRKGPISQKEK